MAETLDRTIDSAVLVRTAVAAVAAVSETHCAKTAVELPTQVLQMVRADDG
jgi:hypothetical protein